MRLATLYGVLRAAIALTTPHVEWTRKCESAVVQPHCRNVALMTRNSLFTNRGSDSPNPNSGTTACTIEKKENRHTWLNESNRTNVICNPHLYTKFHLVHADYMLIVSISTLCAILWFSFYTSESMAAEHKKGYVIIAAPKLIPWHKINIQQSYFIQTFSCGCSRSRRWRSRSHVAYIFHGGCTGILRFARTLIVCLWPMNNARCKTNPWLFRPANSKMSVGKTAS